VAVAIATNGIAVWSHGVRIVVVNMGTIAALGSIPLMDARTMTVRFPVVSIVASWMASVATSLIVDIDFASQSCTRSRSVVLSVGIKINRTSISGNDTP